MLKCQARNQPRFRDNGERVIVRGHAESPFSPRVRVAIRPTPPGHSVFEEWLRAGHLVPGTAGVVTHTLDVVSRGRPAYETRLTERADIDREQVHVLRGIGRDDLEIPAVAEREQRVPCSGTRVFPAADGAYAILLSTQAIP